MSSVSSSTFSSPSSKRSGGGGGGGGGRRGGTAATTNNKKKKKNRDKARERDQRRQEQQLLHQQYHHSNDQSSTTSSERRNKQQQQQYIIDPTLQPQHPQQQYHRRSKRRHTPTTTTTATSNTRSGSSSGSTSTTQEILTSASSSSSFSRASVNAQSNKLMMDVMTDPFKVLQIAVRYDESMATAAALMPVPSSTKSPKSRRQTNQGRVNDDESILMKPLETGRIYDQKSFNAALFLLDAATSTTAPTNTTAATPATVVATATASDRNATTNKINKKDRNVKSSPSLSTSSGGGAKASRQKQYYQKQKQQKHHQHLASLDEEMEEDFVESEEGGVTAMTAETSAVKEDDAGYRGGSSTLPAAVATTTDDNGLPRPTLSLTTFSTRIDFYFDDKSDTDFSFTAFDVEDLSDDQSNIDDDMIGSDHPDPSKMTPLTPIILSGLLANLQRNSNVSDYIDNSTLTTVTTPMDDLTDIEDDETNMNDNVNHQSSGTTSLQHPRMQEAKQQDFPQDSSIALPSSQQGLNSSELVTFTNHLRHAALQRVRLSKERRRIQRIVTPVLAVGASVFLYFFIASSLRGVIDAYGFGRHTCDIGSGEQTGEQSHGYDLACRLAGASVWEHLHGTSQWHSTGAGEGRNGGCKERYSKLYTGGLVPPQTAASQQLQQQLLRVTTGELGADMSCTMTGCFDVESPIPLYSMHTQLYDAFIPLDVVQKGRRSSASYSPGNGESSPGKKLPIQWLGETTVNRLVRQNLAWASSLKSSASKSKKEGKDNTTPGPMRLLDVGSGLSGTLFSLLTSDFPFVFRDDFIYHGISISEPEVKRANELLEVHGIVSSPASPRQIKAAVRRSSFDDELPVSFYNAMVAIESLSFSNNLNKTLHNLASGLAKSPGNDATSVLVIVDDVVHPWADMDRVGRLANATAKHSLLSHSEWSRLLVSAGFTVQRVRDLSLEYDTPYLNPSKCTSSTNGAKNQNQKPSTRQKMKKTWYEVTSELLGRWTRNSDAGILTVVKDLVDNVNAHTEREVAYKDSDLGYYMYVCTL